MTYQSLVPYFKEYLNLHHQLYSGQCKAELWEDITAKALRAAGFGSDWTPDYNHIVGLDQRTDTGVAISNKSGKLNKDNTSIKISGSRLTKHKTIEDKLNFLSNKPEDFIFCLSTNRKEWANDLKKYYFIVIDAKKLDYHNHKWYPTYSRRGDVVTGYDCITENYSAKISNTMSDQLWTDISSNLFEEFYPIEIYS